MQHSTSEYAELCQQLQALEGMQAAGAAHLDAAIQDLRNRIQAKQQESQTIVAPLGVQTAPSPAGANHVPLQLPPIVPHSPSSGSPSPTASGRHPEQASQQQQLQQQQQQQQPLVVATSRACAHNSWDNVRTKKGQVFLRCRVCDSQWRTPVDCLDRCLLFNTPQSCPRGDSCPQLHLHSRKQSLSERVALHGSSVLERVPPGSHEDAEEVNDEGMDDANVTTVRPCGHNSWDNVRSKKGYLFLRCRECEAQWRVPVETVNRCHNFNTPAGCLQGDLCPLLHLHSRKQSLAERLARHGTSILDRPDEGAINGPAAVPSLPVPVGTQPQPLQPQPLQPQHMLLVVRKAHGNSIGMSVKGNLVTKVDPGSPGAIAGLVEGMRVLGINALPVAASTKAVVQAVRDAWSASAEISILVSVGDPVVQPQQQWIVQQQPPPLPPPQPQVYTQPMAYRNDVTDQHSIGSRGSFAGGMEIVATIHRAYVNEALGLSVKGDIVTKVGVNSPAAKEGVVDGMQICAVNGVPVGASTNEVVAAVRNAWLAGCAQLTLRMPGSTAPPPLEQSMSDLCSVYSSEARSRPETPRQTMTHSPYATEAPAGAPNSYVDPEVLSSHSLTSCGPPQLHNAASEVASEGADAEVTIVIRKTQDAFGASVKGNEVSKVTPGSAAADAGVVEGMRILMVNGMPVGRTTVNVVSAVRLAWKQGEVMELVVSKPAPRGSSMYSDAMSIRSMSEGSTWSRHENSESFAQAARRYGTVTCGGVSVTWPAAVLREGESVRGWLDRPYELQNIPPQMIGATLMQPPHKSIEAGTQHSIYFHLDCTLYVFHSNALGRDGGFPTAFQDSEEWQREESTLSWTGSPVAALGLTVWKRKGFAGQTVCLPPTATTHTTFGIAMVRVPDDEDGSLVNASFNSGVPESDEEAHQSRPLSPFDEEASAAQRAQTVPPPQTKTRQRSMTSNSRDLPPSPSSVRPT